MNEQRTIFPSPPTAEATGVARERLPHPLALFMAAATMGILAALAVGFGVGALVVGVSTTNCSPNDGWCDLGAALFGILVGAVTGIVAYIVGGVMTIVRCRPDGARSRHVIAHLLLPVAALAFTSAVGAILG